MTTPSHFAHRIFISHSHEDNDFGIKLAQDLCSALGSESAVWYDALGGVKGGEVWWDKIVKELSTCNTFIVVLSPDAMNSKWVRREFNMALNEGKHILLVLYRKCQAWPDLKPLPAISFLNPEAYEAAFSKLLEGLKSPAKTSMAAAHPTAPQLLKRSISRRAVVGSAIGLLGLGTAAGGITWWVRSHVPQTRNTVIGTTLFIYRGHERKIRALAWSPDGKRIASASTDNTVQVWDATTGNNTISYDSHFSSVEGVAWSHDSRRVASGSADGTVQIWDATTGDPIITYYQGQSVNRIAWSSDGKYVVAGEQPAGSGRLVSAKVWDVSTGKPIVSYQGHTNGVYAVGWAPDNIRVASTSYDDTLQVWDGTTGTPFTTYDAGHDGLALFGLSWSPNGTQIAVACTDNDVRVVDAITGRVLSTFSGHTDWVKDVAWSPDGKYIASGSIDQTVRLWNATTGENIYTYHGQPGHIDAVIWSPDSKLIASGNDIGENTGGTVQVWRAE